MAAEAARLAEVIDGLGLASVHLLGISFGASTALAYAAAHPDRVLRVVTFGCVAAGHQIAPEELQRAVVDTIRAHWGAGSRILADVWLPGADADARDRFARLQRAAATPETAAGSLAAVYRTDIRAVLPQVGVPVLVLHRRGDRAVPYAAAREIAAGIPGARLVPLEGAIHAPWLGNSAEVLDAVLPFLAAGREAAPEPAAEPPPEPDPAPVLTSRECEILRLVADGLGDAEIAARLHLSPHTVHRHVANIRTKLDQPSRAAAVAHAGRLGLI